MFSGAQVSLYPMSDGFVGVITNAVGALDRHRDSLRIETDDVSTLLVGPPETLFTAMQEMFVAAAATGTHCVLSAAISRGCPGEPDDPICISAALTSGFSPLEERKAAAIAAVKEAANTGQPAVGQFSLYVMGGTEDHMDEIYGCIDFLKQSGVFAGSKHFCTKLDGDAGAIFGTLREAFCRFGHPDAHITLDVTISANSPSLA
jgi:hypothetical protein